MESQIAALHKSMQKLPSAPAEVKAEKTTKGKDTTETNQKLMILHARPLNEKEEKRRVVLTKTVVKK